MSAATGRSLLAAVLSAGFGLAWLDHVSPVARAKREGTPLVARLSVRAEDDPGARPAEYLLLYDWASRVLSLALASSRQAAEDAAAPSVVFETALPSRSGPPDSPEAVRARLLGLGRVRGLGRYDAALLALEAYRLGPGSVRLAWLPAPPLDRRLVDILLGRAAPEAGAVPLVEILNASGEPGVALRATKVLRLRQADVVEFGNAAAEAERTHLIDRAGDIAGADAVRRALGCARAEVFTRLEVSPRATLAVVLGKDYRACLELRRRVPNPQ